MLNEHVSRKVPSLKPQRVEKKEGPHWTQNEN